MTIVKGGRINVTNSEGVNNFSGSSGTTGIPTNSDVTILEIQSPVSLDYMEWWVSDAERVPIVIEFLDSEGNWQYNNHLVIASAKAYSREITLKRLVEESSAEFVVLKYDTNTGAYKAASTQSIHFANGVRIKALNKSGANENQIGYSIRGREYL